MKFVFVSCPSFLSLSQAVDFNIFEGLECHGVPVYVISRGKVVVDHGKVDVVKGSGKFVPRQPWTDFVYSRVYQRDKVRINGFGGNEILP